MVKNKYGKGNGCMGEEVVSFYTDEQKDIDQKHTLNPSNPKAFFMTKPVRGQTVQAINTRPLFFKFESIWMERLHILKNKSLYDNIYQPFTNRSS